MTLEMIETLPAADMNTDEITVLNRQLEQKTAQQRTAWALNHLPGGVVLSSSFGIQAAVMLHLLTQEYPDIPVIVTDTGYLFPETYRFIEQLTETLKLNLHVVRADMSPAWQEAKFGKRWQQDSDALVEYNRMNKIEPMQRALTEFGAKTWFAGLRRSQSEQRNRLGVLQILDDYIKVFPIIDWTNKDIHYYLKEHNLPYHPLWEKGYTSIGDWHSTQPQTLGMSEQDTRFGGAQRECGLHEFGDGI